jgi:hypothetical protein
VFVLGKPFQPGLTFAGKAMSLPEWIQILDLDEKVAEENTGLIFFVSSITSITKLQQ